MSSISEFTAELRKTNLGRPYLYYVEIFSPLCLLTDGNTYNNSKINMFCHGASTPFISMFTNDDYNENGVKRKYAYDYDYQNLVLHFYVDQKYDTKSYFDNWMSKIAPSNRKFNYYDDYRSPLIRVSIINTAGNDTYQYTYISAVPKTLSNIDLSYSATGTVSTFNVEFVYENIAFSKLSGTTVPPDPTPPPEPTPNIEIEQYLGLKFNSETPTYYV